MTKIQTLITTVNMDDSKKLLESMNVKHNYIIGNQCSHNSIVRDDNGLVVNTDMRGVGQNRNSIIERSDADICVLADDDMRFCDDYEEIVERVFERNPDSDLIIFNFIEESEGRRVSTKTKKITKKNYMNYGAARFAFRRANLAYHAIFFNKMFGGGTPHQCGEDSLFLNSCLKAGLKVVAVPDALAYLQETRESTWFKGYNEKYFFDKGVFLGIAHPKMGKLMAMLLIAKHKEYRESRSFYECFKLVSAGIKFSKSKDKDNRITN